MWCKFLVGIFFVSVGKCRLIYNDNSLSSSDTENRNDLDLNSKSVESVESVESNNILRNDDDVGSYDRSRDALRKLTNELSDLLSPRNNILRSRNKKKRKRRKRKYDSEEKVTTLSWQKEWKKKVLTEMEKNSHRVTTPRGDYVNMVSARPWGLPCGDRETYKQPYGSCVHAMECESEYRIYRGDLFCGQGEFVCCSLHVSSFDFVHGLDPDLDYKTDFDDSKEDESSGEREKREKRNAKLKKKRLRKARKKAMQKKIKTLMGQIMRKLKEVARNNTLIYNERQKEMKKKLKQEKKRIREEREEQQREWNEKMEKQELEVMDEMESKLSEITSQFDKLASKNKKSLRNDDIPLRTEDNINYDVEYGLLYS